MTCAILVAVVLAVIAAVVPAQTTPAPAVKPTEEFVVIIKNTTGSAFFSSGAIAYDLLVTYGRPKLSGEIVRFRRLKAREPADRSQIWMTYKFTPSLGQRFITDAAMTPKPAYFDTIGIAGGARVELEIAKVGKLGSGQHIATFQAGGYDVPLYLEPFWYVIIALLVIILVPVVEAILNGVCSNDAVDEEEYGSPESSPSPPVQMVMIIPPAQDQAPPPAAQVKTV